jgi:signal transduction histidine kinase
VIELAHLSAIWPLAASTALVLTVQGLRAGRRRTALNEAMHELRRPLHAIALASSGQQARRASVVEGSMALASAALDRLDREINGGAPPALRGTVSIQPLVRAAVGRWKARAALVGASVEMRWPLGGVMVEGDPSGLAQAIDNLIVNAIEHGGPAIVVEGQLRRGRLCLSVADSGRSSRPQARRGNPAETIARLAGKRRHGHGLAVVRRVAAAHGGRFVLRHSAHESVARLELPLAGSGAFEGVA